MMNVNAAQYNMIHSQIRANKIVNETTLSVIENTPRDFFVPKAFAEQAYSEMVIPLDFEQAMLRPIEEAKIIDSLNLQTQQSVLEIGTGTGYFTALLSKLVQQVDSVDIFPEFTQSAINKLNLLGINNVNCCTGDAATYWLDAQLYDVIIMTGSLLLKPEQYLASLKVSGKLFAIIGSNDTMRATIYEKLAHSQISTKTIFEMSTKALINAPAPEPFQF